MTKIKSVFAAFICSLLALCGNITSAGAAEQPVLSLTSASVTAGDTVDIALTISGNPGITAISVQVDYPDSLELLDIRSGGLFDNVSFGSRSHSPMIISWYDASSGDRTDNGTLAVMKFRVKTGAESTAVKLSYDEENIFNSSFDNVSAAVKDGVLTVKAPFLSGDVDQSGRVDIGDATMIQRYLAQYAEFDKRQLALADVDRSGMVDILDVTFLQKTLAEII